MKMVNQVLAALLAITLMLSIIAFADGSGEAETIGIKDFGFISNGEIIESLENVKRVSAFVNFTSKEDFKNTVLFLAVYKDSKLQALKLTKPAGFRENWVQSMPVDVGEFGVVVKAMLVQSVETIMPIAFKSLTKEPVLNNRQIEYVVAEDTRITVKYRETLCDKYTKSISFPANADCYINEAKVDTSTGWKDILGKESFYGNVKFIKEDSNEEYTAVYITNYRNLCVDTVNRDEGIIIGKNSEMIKFAISENVDAKVYGPTGQEMGWSNLEEYDMLSYTYANIDGIDTYRAWLSGDTVTGMIEGSIYEGTKDMLAEIDGQSYGIDAYLMPDELGLGDKGVFYLDILGNIAWCDTTVAIEKKEYGYLDKAIVWQDFNPTLQFRLFTRYGQLQTFTLNSSVRINDTTVRLYDMTDAELNALAEEYCGQLIVYTTNSENNITSFYTAKALGGKHDFVQYCGQEFEFAVYEKIGNQFNLGTGGAVYATSRTSIIYAPQGDGYNVDDYKILSPGYIGDLQEFQNISFYNVNEENSAWIILIKGSADFIPEKAMVSVASALSYTTDSSGKNIYKISAFKACEDTGYITNGQVEKESLPSLGSAFIPTLQENGTATGFKEYTVVTEDSVSLGKDAVNTDDNRYYMGDIKQVKGATAFLADDTQIRVPFTANVYLYDARLHEKYRLSKNEDLSAVIVDYDERTGVTTYEDRIGEISDYVIFANEYNNRIVDVMLYINLPFTQE